MKSKEEIVKILIDNFRNIYCDTCNGKYCEDCYRKNIGWEISDNFAEVVANEILK